MRQEWRRAPWLSRRQIFAAPASTEAFARRAAFLRSNARRADRRQGGRVSACGIPPLRDIRLLLLLLLRERIREERIPRQAQWAAAAELPALCSHRRIDTPAAPTRRIDFSCGTSLPTS